ncbi:MAG TPA: 50S ribosomal protein L18 [Bacteroidetes bacterium]|nr:50S ribosomal protein L18 [Bacteroidota bacterium]
MANKKDDKTLARLRRKKRIRKKVHGTPERPRLVVFRSAKHIYAQLVDDVNQKTLTGVSTITPALREELQNVTGKIEKAKIVGKAIAEKAKELGVSRVVFDRGGYRYHGRVKAVAEGAREGGLEF